MSAHNAEKDRRPRAALAETDEGQRVLFWCPGCNEGHQVYIGTWTWNGSLDLPTFTPSVLIRGNQWPKDEYPEYHKAAHGSVSAGGETVCHTFVTDGRIQFLGDCTHALAGQTVDLPEWPPARHDRGCAASVASSARCTCVIPPAEGDAGVTA